MPSHRGLIHRRGLVNLAVILMIVLVAAAWRSDDDHDGPPATEWLAQGVESDTIPFTAAAAGAQGDSAVIVRLADGRMFTLAHASSEGESFVRYGLEGFLFPLDSYLIRADFYEGSGYVLVHRQSGDTVWIDSPPVPSPSERRFVTASMDLDIGHQPTRLRIFSVSAEGEFTHEWTLETYDEGWGPSDPWWAEDSVIRFRRKVPGSDPYTYRWSVATVRFVAGGWQLEP